MLLLVKAHQSPRKYVAKDFFYQKIVKWIDKRCKYVLHFLENNLNKVFRLIAYTN